MLTNMENLNVYLAPVFKRINEIERKYNKYKAESGDNVYLIKYHESFTKLLKMLSPSKDEVEKLDVDAILKLYCQAVLDFTYFEENKLVDDDFTAKNSNEIIAEIISELSQVEKLHAESSKLTLVEALGVELVECLHWRKGALLYMYCHTLNNDPKRRQNSDKLILKNSQEGVISLQKMLSVREKNIQWSSEPDTQSTNTLSLLQQGIFGDTHMLAAMYAGEMCYWFWTLSRSANYIDSDESLSQFNKDVKTTAKSLLNLYVSAADGPLSNMGWTSVRAKQILKEMS